MRSGINHFLRSIAKTLPNDSILRNCLSKAWSKLLSISGETIKIPIGSSMLSVLTPFRTLNRDYEKETLFAWLKLVKPHYTIWDVGSNIGIYSVLTGMKLGPEGTIVAFEASPDSHRTTKRHLEINHISAHFRTIHCAVSDVDSSTVNFSIVSQFEPTNRIGAISPNTITVATITLDAEMQRQNGTPDLIKIDIEGAEALALKGAEEMMTHPAKRPIILLEVHPMYLTEFHSSASELYEMVTSRGYSVLSQSGEPRSGFDYDEYFLVPNEKIQEVAGILSAL